MTQTPPEPDDTPEQIRVRHEKRARMLEAGVEAYPVSVGRTHSLAQVRDRWGSLAAGEETDEVVTVAARVVFVRNTGKLCFGTLQEGFGPLEGSVATGGGAGPSPRLQVMLSLAEVGEAALAAWKADVDLGDHVAVTGRVICSRRGELSVMATSWTMASKALRPLPVLHRELSEETRVRQRYADLVVREEARDVVRRRSAAMRAVRRVLEEQQYLEIETPVLQLVHGGAAARPFTTHMNAFDQSMTLRIALELNLKKAVVGGVDRVFEIGRIFRNEGVDATHSPEFTMLEAYRAWADQETMADLTRELFLAVADTIGTGGDPRRVGTAAGVVDLDGPWRWLPVHEAVSEAVGEEVTPETSPGRLRAWAAEHEVEVDPEWGADKLVLELLGELVEPTLLHPTFLCDYPASAQPLARPHRSKPGLIEAWDLVVAGVERATAFSELVDPVVQREVLEAQSLLAADGDPEAMLVDEDFLRALEYGAPPMGGMGLGIDRLLALFTGGTLRETILFPHLRPETR